MTTHGLLIGFGEVSFDLLWNGNETTMQGWEQPEYVSTEHIPGSDFNDTFYMGSGPLTRSFTVELEDRFAYEALHALKRTIGTLRVPATLNELGVAVEVDYFGAIYAEIPDVVLIGLSNPRVGDGVKIEATATFQRDSRS